PDRGARLREGAEGGEKSRRRHGGAAAGAQHRRALSFSRRRHHLVSAGPKARPFVCLVSVPACAVTTRGVRVSSLVPLHSRHGVARRSTLPFQGEGEKSGPRASDIVVKQQTCVIAPVL